MVALVHIATISTNYMNLRHSAQSCTEQSDHSVYINIIEMFDYAFFKISNFLPLAASSPLQVIRKAHIIKSTSSVLVFIIWNDDFYDVHLYTSAEKKIK